ncbi:RICIN domain-containing protein [Kitasatospora sp. NPDC050543]|uniref:RICIN domain-containing protein n=1 Tax=Kitasatospora sp. NPDC050543 TaxID=3364054 RepID=UPI00379D6DAA
MPDPVAAVLTDADLAGRIRAGHGRDRSAVEEVSRRHRAAVLAYAGRCCQDKRVAEELADEVLERIVEAVRSGAGPTEAWRPHLLTATRRAAARLSGTDRDSALSVGFAAWLASLPRPEAAELVPETAVLAAEKDSLILLAFRSLPEARQAELWRCLDGAPGNPETRQPGAASAPISGTAAARPDASAQRSLYEAYLQAFVARTANRSCRHLAAVLADRVRRGTADEARGAESHFARCHSCQRARTELVAIHAWQQPVVLRALLLWVGEPSSNLPSVADPRTVPLPAAVPSPSRARTRERRTRGPHPLGYAVAAATGGLAALLAAAVVLATIDSGGTRPPLTVPILLPASTASALTTRVTDTSASPSGSASATPSPSASTAPVPGTSSSPGARVMPPAPATDSPSSTAPVPGTSSSPSARVTPPAPATDSPSPSTSSAPTGQPLVNRRSGLCVGVAGGSGDLQLQTCTGGGNQSWKRLAADQGAYQLRNTGTGMCLDGTTGEGNVVAVTLRTCLSDTNRAEQLWEFSPGTEPGTFRLLFLPQVRSSDYSSHLLGPQNWANADPPRVGSNLVQLPNYYNSSSFLFTLG